MNNLQLNYFGKVEIKFKVGDKVFSINTHNASEEGLRKSFAKFISGNYQGMIDIPSYLDIRDARGTSILTQLIPLSATSYDKNITESGYDWYALVNAGIKYSYLLSPVIEGSGDYRIYLLGSYDATMNSGKGGNSELASFDIDSSDLSKITPGTEGIIDWKLFITDAE